MRGLEPLAAPWKRSTRTLHHQHHYRKTEGTGEAGGPPWESALIRRCNQPLHHPAKRHSGEYSGTACPGLKVTMANHRTATRGACGRDSEELRPSPPEFK